MPDLPPALLELASNLQTHRRFLRELERAGASPGFQGLPQAIHDRHKDFIVAHRDSLARLDGAPFPEPLVEALVGFLDRQEVDLAGHPTARHLDCLQRVLRRGAALEL